MTDKNPEVDDTEVDETAIDETAIDDTAELDDPPYFHDPEGFDAETTRPPEHLEPEEDD